MHHASSRKAAHMCGEAIACPEQRAVMLSARNTSQEVSLPPTSPAHLQEVAPRLSGLARDWQSPTPIDYSFPPGTGTKSRSSPAVISHTRKFTCCKQMPAYSTFQPSHCVLNECLVVGSSAPARQSHLRVAIGLSVAPVGIPGAGTCPDSRPQRIMARV